MRLAQEPLPFQHPRQGDERRHQSGVRRQVPGQDPAAAEGPACRQDWPQNACGARGDGGGRRAGARWHRAGGFGRTGTTNLATHSLAHTATGEAAWLNSPEFLDFVMKYAWFFNGKKTVQLVEEVSLTLSDVAFILVSVGEPPVARSRKPTRPPWRSPPAFSLKEAETRPPPQKKPLLHRTSPWPPPPNARRCAPPSTSRRGPP